MSEFRSLWREAGNRASGVSAIIPAHNAADTPGRTLESLRAQTYANREAIVDDGSEDRTGLLAQQRTNIARVAAT